MLEMMPTPKDRKEMTDGELLQEYPKIGFTFQGFISNSGCSGLEIEGSRMLNRYRIPTATPNQSIAIQEALFSLTNIFVIQGNQHWIQQYQVRDKGNNLFLTVYLYLFPAADYIRRLFI